MTNDAGQAPQIRPLVPPLGQAQPQPQVAPQHELKYHAQLQAFSNCPPAGNSGIGIGYRWCFEDINDQRNSLPVSMLNPDGRRCCNGYALSMFTTLDQAVARFNSLKNRFPEYETRVGTHYAQVRLRAEDGRSTPASNDGHFDFHEYTTFRLASSVLEHLRRPE